MTLKNRFTYHPPTDAQKLKYEAIRRIALKCATWIDENVPDSREKSLAITHIEEAVFWANAAIARNIDLTGLNG